MRIGYLERDVRTVQGRKDDPREVHGEGDEGTGEGTREALVSEVGGGTENCGRWR